MITRLTDLDADTRTAALAAVRVIFFATSVRRNFADDAARDRFWDTWTGWYRRQAPDDIWLALDDAGTVTGYLTGCRDSGGSTALFGIIPKYGLFADLFPAFPAHFHVNVGDGQRGQGIGARLVARFVEDCGSGVHLVTGPAAANIPFYQRQGFTHAVERDGLLFLGRPAR